MKLTKLDLTNSLIIGDVHSCPDHLDQLLAVVPQEYEKIVFLGDLVDRGPDPNGVIQRVHALVKKGKATVIMGNHDWKYVRLLNGNNKVSMKAEQQKTLAQLTDQTKEMILEIFPEVIVGGWDPALKIMLGHAAAGRPLRIFEKAADYLTKETGTEIAVDDLLHASSVTMSKRVATLFIYGLVDGNKTDVNGFPLRLPITKSIEDTLDGWHFIHGHTHARNLYPEEGNKHIVCVDWACGEPDGKLAALLVKKGMPGVLYMTQAA